MKSRINFSISFVGIILLTFVSVGSAKQSVADVNALSFPYVGEITSNDVYIRSGPGTNHYYCGKLNKGETVKVISRKFSWSRIVPPTGSFSWISKQYVVIDVNSPNTGIVTGDEVRVYAGSDYFKPIHSEKVQLKLNKGDKVMLKGEEAGDYYKIFPPNGAYLWVNTEYIKPVASVVPPVVTEPKIEITETKIKIPAASTNIPTEAGELEKYYVLQKQIEAEKHKAPEQQDYSKIKKLLSQIAEKKEAGKAARYAEFATKQVERYELATAVNKQSKLQNTQLQKIYERIDKAHAKRLEEFQDLGKFAVVGILKTSNVYGPEAELLHYRMVDNAGKVICYALPSGATSIVKLSEFVNKKVGLVGTIEPHPQTAGALVKFTGINEVR